MQTFCSGFGGLGFKAQGLGCLGSVLGRRGLGSKVSGLGPSIHREPIPLH